jgi:folate-dependent tRNA-U54 methylase TrmFO/GidA
MAVARQWLGKLISTATNNHAPSTNTLAVVRQQHGKHVSAVMNKQATIEVFSMRSVPRLYTSSCNGNVFCQELLCW